MNNTSFLFVIFFRYGAKEPWQPFYHGPAINAYVSRRKASQALRSLKVNGEYGGFGLSRGCSKIVKMESRNA